MNTAIIFILGFITLVIADKNFGVTWMRRLMLAYALLLIGHHLHNTEYIRSTLLFVGIIIYVPLARIRDKTGVQQAKTYIQELHTLIEQGWGQVDKANQLRSKIYNVWESLPTKCQKEIKQYELEIRFSCLTNPLILDTLKETIERNKQ